MEIKAYLLEFDNVDGLHVQELFLTEERASAYQKSCTEAKCTNITSTRLFALTGQERDVINDFNAEMNWDD